MALELGRRPNDLIVWLTPTGRFNTVLRQWDSADPDTRQAVDWAVPPVLAFPDAQVADWESVVVGNEATFTADPAAVQALIDSDEQLALLRIGDVVWARGRWKVGVNRG